MRWPWAADPPPSPGEAKRRPVSWTDTLNATDWAHYAEPRTVIPSVLLTLTTLALLRVYKAHLRRIPSVDHIKPDKFRTSSLFGKVTSVGDADNFRLFHTPGGRLAGWGWAPGRRVEVKKGIGMKTVCTRSSYFCRGHHYGVGQITESVMADTRPHRRHRRPRARALRPSRAALREGSACLAHGLHPRPPRQGIHPQARPV